MDDLVEGDVASADQLLEPFFLELDAELDLGRERAEMGERPAQRSGKLDRPLQAAAVDEQYGIAGEEAVLEREGRHEGDAGRMDLADAEEQQPRLAARLPGFDLVDHAPRQIGVAAGSRQLDHNV